MHVAGPLLDNYNAVTLWNWLPLCYAMAFFMLAPRHAFLAAAAMLVFFAACTVLRSAANTPYAAQDRSLMINVLISHGVLVVSLTGMVWLKHVVAVQGEPLPAGGEVPDPHDPILAGRCQGPAVGAEGHALDEVGQAGEVRLLAEGGQVPDSHLAGRPLGLIRTSPPRRRQAPAVGAEGHADDGSPMAAQGPHLQPGGGVPEPDDSVPGAVGPQ